MKKSAALALLPEIFKRGLSLTERGVQQAQQNTDPWANLSPTCKTAVESMFSENQLCQLVLDKYLAGQDHLENPFNCDTDDNNAFSTEASPMLIAITYDCYWVPDVCNAQDKSFFDIEKIHIISSLLGEACPSSESPVCDSRCFRSLRQFYPFTSDRCMEQVNSFLESDDDCKSLKRKARGDETFLEDTYECLADSDNSDFYVQYADFISRSKSCLEKYLSQGFSECFDLYQVEQLHDDLTNAISPYSAWGFCDETECAKTCRSDKELDDIFNAETTQPSTQPGSTTQPTTQPGNSTQPSTQPGSTTHPTTHPTAHPTTHPTAHPTTHPTAHPTTRPTGTTPLVGGETSDTSAIGVSIAAVVGTVFLAAPNVYV